MDISVEKSSIYFHNVLVEILDVEILDDLNLILVILKMVLDIWVFFKAFMCFLVLSHFTVEFYYKHYKNKNIPFWGQGLKMKEISFSIMGTDLLTQNNGWLGH